MPKLRNGIPAKGKHCIKRERTDSLGVRDRRSPNFDANLTVAPVICQGLDNRGRFWKVGTMIRRSEGQLCLN